MSERNKIIYSQWTFVDKDIQSGSIYLATSLMSDTLEANTISATVECSDKSIIDFERNTPLTYYNRGQQKGIFYVQSISRIGPELYEISATSAIGLLIEGLHYGGIYTGQTVAEVLPGICGTVPYVIKTNLRDIVPRRGDWQPAIQGNIPQVGLRLAQPSRRTWMVCFTSRGFGTASAEPLPETACIRAQA